MFYENYLCKSNRKIAKILKFPVSVEIRSLYLYSLML